MSTSWLEIGHGGEYLHHRNRQMLQMKVLFCFHKYQPPKSPWYPQTSRLFAPNYWASIVLLLPPHQPLWKRTKWDSNQSFHGVGYRDGLEGRRKKRMLKGEGTHICSAPSFSPSFPAFLPLYFLPPYVLPSIQSPIHSIHQIFANIKYLHLPGPWEKINAKALFSLSLEINTVHLGVGV